MKIGSKDGALVRVLASHQRGPGLILPGAKCRLSLLLVLALLQGFFSKLSSFPLPPQKPISPNSN